MATLTQAEARALLEKVLAFSTADECEVNLNGNQGGNIRYARNTVTTSGSEQDISLVVQASFGRKSGTATINELDDASLQKAVQRAEELARLAPENPEYMERLGPQSYVETPTFVPSTANVSPNYRAEVARSSIEPAKVQGVTAAGFFQDGAGFSAMMNSRGLFAYNRSTGMNFSVTMRTEDGTGSGYVSRDYNDIDQFEAASASEIALEKAVRSREARAIEPGKYTVVLEPLAVGGLLGNMIFSMNARQADEGRSFLARPGGGTKLGEKIVDERVTVYSDPAHPQVPVSPWTGDGRPRSRTTWIDEGVVENLYYTRYWAGKQGVAATPPPGNVIMEGGEASLDELIRGTNRGILVTRFWYIRSVDPQTLLVTGLTRDGTFYIENGQVRYPVKNFRFNESPIIMLNNLEAMGRPMRVNGNLLPPLKVRDFTFTSLSDAV